MSSSINRISAKTAGNNRVRSVNRIFDGLVGESVNRAKVRSEKNASLLRSR